MSLQSITWSAELCRIFGVPNTEVAKLNHIQISVMSHSSRFKASVILARIQCLFANVITYFRDPDTTELQEDEPCFVIDFEYWSSVLPTWFLQATPFEITRQQTPHLYNDNIFTVESWLYWFINPYQSRTWIWQTSKIRSDTMLEITIEVIDTPFAWEALRWAIIAAGADLVDMC